MTQSIRPIAPDHLARMHRAVDEVLQSVGFPPGALDQRQSAPNKARLTTPPSPNLQNEATCHNGTAASIPAAPFTHANPHPSAPNHAKARPQTPICKTNPAPHPELRTQRPDRPLTAVQLRAARLFVAGHSTNAVAGALAIDRHTLATWKKKPLFQLELRRLLETPPSKTSFDTLAPGS
jgi:DNA-binding CsgD family transcriptional regulator